MSTKQQEQITALRRAIAEKNRRIAELRQQVAENRYTEWRQQLMAWAETPDADIAEMPAPPDGLSPLAEMTDEERAAREAWIDQVIEDAQKRGIL